MQRVMSTLEVGGGWVGALAALRGGVVWARGGWEELLAVEGGCWDTPAGCGGAGLGCTVERAGAGLATRLAGLGLVGSATWGGLLTWPGATWGATSARLPGSFPSFPTRVLADLAALGALLEAWGGGVAKPAPKHENAAPKPTKTVYEKNPEYCANARKNLEVIGRAPRIRMPDENGDLRYITDEEREAEKQKNLEIIETHCE